MKGNKKTNLMISIIMIIIAMVIGYIFNNSLYRSDNYFLLSRHFDSMEMLEESKGYSIAYIIFRYYILLILTCLFLAIMITINYFIEKRKYKHYPHIFQDYQGSYFFFLSIILLLLIAVATLESVLAIELMVILMFFIIMITALASYKLGNIIYNNIFQRIKEFNNNNFEIINEENRPYKKYKIVPIFYILLVIFTITYGYKIYQFTPYLKYISYPKEIIVTDDSYISKDKRWYPGAKNTTVSFINSSNNLFDNYEVITIEFQIYSETSIEMLENNDYQILIEYNLEKLYLTEEDFVIDKANDQFKIIINLNNYCFKEEDFGILDITFVDDEKGIYEEQPIVEYNITIIKIKN